MDFINQKYGKGMGVAKFLEIFHDFTKQKRRLLRWYTIHKSIEDAILQGPTWVTSKWYHPILSVMIKSTLTKISEKFPILWDEKH